MVFGGPSFKVMESWPHRRGVVLVCFGVFWCVLVCAQSKNHLQNRVSEQLIFRLHFFVVILATTVAFDKNNHRNAIFWSHICSRSEKIRIFTQKCDFPTIEKNFKSEQ